MSIERHRVRIGHIYPIRRRIGHIYPLRRSASLGRESEAQDKVQEVW